MTSSNVYKQSVFDHRSILLSVSVIEDGSLNVKQYNRLFNKISQQYEAIKINSPINNEDDGPLKKIYFNFKRNYSIAEKKWENFQLHHRAVGLVFIGEFKCGNDFYKLLKLYSSEKEKGVGSVLESRLVLIYDENNEQIVRALRRSLSWDDELGSSDDIHETNIMSNEPCDTNCDQELGYIKDSMLQNDIIWYQKSLIGGNHSESTCSLTDSSSSNYSTAWKISSHNSDNSIASPQLTSMRKSPSLLSDSINTRDSGCVNHFESLEFYSFLKTIYEKLSSALSNRETSLTNKTEQTLSRSSNLETSSDSGSTLSLDDLDFNLTDPIDIDRKKFQDEHRFNKTNKTRHYLGRLEKQCGDYALLCGNYWQSYHHYQMSICYLKKYNNDQLWLAGAEEGLCCAWIAFNFDSNLTSFDKERNESLHSKCRQAFVNQLKTTYNQPVNADVTSPLPPSPNIDQLDFSFFKKFASTDLFKNPPEIHTLDDLNEKYLVCIGRYKRLLKPKFDGLHPINMDSCIKASRFFMERHRYLEASNFLKLIKSDLVLLDHDHEIYHNTLAKLYSQMGFRRKSMVHKYETLLSMQANLSSQSLTINTETRQRNLTKRLGIMSDILANLNLDISALLAENNDEKTISLIDNVNNREFESLKQKMVLEVFGTCMLLDYSATTRLGFGLSLLDNWHLLLTYHSCQRLLDDIGNICVSEVRKDSSQQKQCVVKNLPRLTKIIPRQLPDYLLPKRKQTATDSKSVFIFTPLIINKRANHTTVPDKVVWVCGEECELVLLFDNLLPIPLQLTGLAFQFSDDDGQELWLSAEGSSVHLLPSNSHHIHCHFVIIPSLKLIPIGEYRLTNISYEIISLINVTFYPQRIVTDTPVISICAMMPQMRILSSIHEHSIARPRSPVNNPANTVLVSNIAVYENELFEFTLFLSNESKDLDIDRVRCGLDELQLSTVSAMLVSRVSDDEYNNRRQSTHRMLSLVNEHIINTLSIKSIASLQNTSANKSDSPNMPPTEAPIKFRIDVTDREFSGELFRKMSAIKNEASNPEPIWKGQFRISFCYGSGSEWESKEDDESEICYRESVYVLNCHLVLGLCVVGYSIERSLDVLIILRNFSDNKMKVDVYWKECKINNRDLVIVPNLGQISQSANFDRLQRLSSTECSSHILNYRINGDILDLKSLVANGTLRSPEDLTNYVQSNLRMSWTTKDKSLDKIRHGNVNLMWCLCQFDRVPLYPERAVATPIAHQLAFSINDMIKIWFGRNVMLEMSAYCSESADDCPIPPKSPSRDPISIHVLESIRFRIKCHFIEEHWADHVSDDVISRVVLRCCVMPTSAPNRSDSSSEDDNRFQHCLLGGNSALRLHKDIINNGTELNGVVLFLLKGVYSVNSQLVITDDNADNNHGSVQVLEESNRYEVHVTGL